MLKPGGLVFSKEKPINWLSDTKQSTLKIYIQLVLYKLICCIYVFRSLCVHTYKKKETREMLDMNSKRAKREGV